MRSKSQSASYNLGESDTGIIYTKLEEGEYTTLLPAAAATVTVTVTTTTTVTTTNWRNYVGTNFYCLHALADGN